MALEVGLRAAIVHEVAAEDTALSVGSGDVPVLATPRLVGLAEAACVAALADAALPASSTTVGTRIEIEHAAAVVVGDIVRVSARLVAVEGRSLRFDVVATDDGDRQIARGSIHRVVVDRERFMARAQNR